MWMAALIALAGDIEPNPGPYNKTKTRLPSKYICPVCSLTLNFRSQPSVKCHHPSHTTLHNKYIHLNPCALPKPASGYLTTWTCSIHNASTHPSLPTPPSLPITQPLTSPPLSTPSLVPKHQPTHHQNQNTIPQNPPPPPTNKRPITYLKLFPPLHRNLPRQKT